MRKSKYTPNEIQTVRKDKKLAIRFFIFILFLAEYVQEKEGKVRIMNQKQKIVLYRTLGTVKGYLTGC